MSGLINKAKEMLSGGDKSRDDNTSSSYDSTSRNTTGHNTSGPRGSDMANRADPRVDSDRDGRRGVESSGYGSSNTGTGYGSSTASGPHDSSMSRHSPLKTM